MKYCKLQTDLCGIKVSGKLHEIFTEYEKVLQWNLRIKLHNLLKNLSCPFQYCRLKFEWQDFKYPVQNSRVAGLSLGNACMSSSFILTTYHVNNTKA